MLYGQTLPNSRYRFDVHDTIEDDWEEKEHGRPIAMSRKSGYTYPGRGGEDDERRRRFAHRVVEWLETASGAWDDLPVALFAPPRMLGVLRQAFPAVLTQRVELTAADLRPTKPQDLQHHPLIKPLLDGSLSR